MCVPGPRRPTFRSMLQTLKAIFAHENDANDNIRPVTSSRGVSAVRRTAAEVGTRFTAGLEVLSDTGLAFRRVQ